MNRLLSPNLWIGIFSIMALLGTILAAFGIFSGNQWMKLTAFILICPIMITGGILVVIVIPLIAIDNKRNRQSKQETPESSSVKTNEINQ
ncbi:MAG: hypothetical protein Tsb009_24940 [Planctomycetaceae bacterium]